MVDHATGITNHFSKLYPKLGYFSETMLLKKGKKKEKKSKSFIHCYCSMLFSLSRVKHTLWWNTTYNCHFVAHENENWDWCNLNFRWTHFSEQRTTHCGNRLPLRYCKIEKRLSCRSNLKLIYLRDQASHDSGNFFLKNLKNAD